MGTSGDIGQLQHCPNFELNRHLLDGKTRAIPFPAKGFNCFNDGVFAQQTPGQGMGPVPTPPQQLASIGLTEAKKEDDPTLHTWDTAPHVDSSIYSPDVKGLQLCPNWDDRHTLLDGVTPAVPYPKSGYNCFNDGVYAKKQAAGSIDKNAPIK